MCVAQHAQRRIRDVFRPRPRRRGRDIARVTPRARRHLDFCKRARVLVPEGRRRDLRLQRLPQLDAEAGFLDRLARAVSAGLEALFAQLVQAARHCSLVLVPFRFCAAVACSCAIIGGWAIAGFRSSGGRR